MKKLTKESSYHELYIVYRFKVNVSDRIADIVPLWRKGSRDQMKHWYTCKSEYERM